MSPNPVTELNTQLAGLSLRCRARRWFGALFHVGVSQDIAADIVREERRKVDLAYAAEQADLEAVKDIQRFIANGNRACDLPILKKALRQINRSSRLDHNLCERAQA